MKNISTFLIFSAFVFSSAFFSQNAFAASTTSPSTPIATVDIQHAKIISQKDNVFDISFDLTNREGQQTGVKYGVQLISGNAIVDEKAYDESLTLQEHSSIPKEITYTAPKELNGTYNLFLVSNNKNGFPFSVAFTGKVTLNSTIKGFEVVTSSCYLKVEGEKSNKHYGLLQGVDISPDETLRLTCNTINHTNNALSLTPSFETRYRSTYGDIAPSTGGDASSISFVASKSENFSILLPKGTIPQLYDLKVALTSEQVNSNPIDLHYFIRGTSATIQNLSLDKDLYQRGDTAHLSLIWTKFGDQFLRTDVHAISPEKAVISLSAHLSNGNGMSCGETFNQVITKDPSRPVTDVPILVTGLCRNPQVSLALADSLGTVLDQKDFAFKSVQSSGSKPLNSRATLILVIVLIIIAIYMMKKKKGNSVHLGVLFFILTVLGGALPAHKVSATTYPAGATGDLLSTVTTDSSNYLPGTPITVSASMVSNATYSNLVNLKATTTGNSTLTLIPDQTIGGGDTILTVYDAFVNPGAPSTPGSYLVDFSTGVFENDIVILDTPPGGDPGYYAHCFIADTLVTLANGTKKNIQDIKIGDVLKGETSNNTVLAFHRPKLEGGALYSFNGGKHFVTAEHPFKTMDGWKSIDPKKTEKENIGIEVTELAVGDTLITSEGVVKLESVDASYEAKENTDLYNFILDGDHTYYADDYLVHNKQQCGGSLPACGETQPCVYDDIQNPAYGQPVLGGDTGVCALTCSGNPTTLPGTCTIGGGMYCSTNSLKKCN